MSCENYREALIEAAATDAAPPAELRSHLEACTSCRAAFSEELQLFADIDTGLRATANAEVPSSFLPRIRARLEDASAAPRRWRPSLIFAGAAAAIAVTVFIAARPRHALNDNQANHIVAAPAGEKLVTPARREVAESPVIVASAHTRRIPRRKHSNSPNYASSGQLEVLVPPEEREEFARFVLASQERSEVALRVVVPASDKKEERMVVDLLQIAKLEVRLLDWPESEISGGIEENR